MDSTPQPRGDGAPAAPRRARSSATEQAAEKYRRHDQWLAEHRPRLAELAKAHATSLPVVLAVLEQFVKHATLHRPTADDTIGQLEYTTGHSRDPIGRAIAVLTEAGALRTVKPAAGPGKGRTGVAGRGAVRAVVFFEDDPTDVNPPRERGAFTGGVDNPATDVNPPRERGAFPVNTPRNDRKPTAPARPSTDVPLRNPPVSESEHNPNTTEPGRGGEEEATERTFILEVARRWLDHEMTTGTAGRIRNPESVVTSKAHSKVLPTMEKLRAENSTWARWLNPVMMADPEARTALVQAMVTKLAEGGPANPTTADKLEAHATSLIGPPLAAAG